MSARGARGVRGACAACLTLVALLPLAAQPPPVRGVAVDAASERPVPGAEAALLRDGRPLAIASADSLGAFVLAVPASARGRLTVRVRRLGYAPAETAPFDPAMLGDGRLEVRLRALPRLLDTVRADVEVPPHLRAFEARRHRLTGTFFTRDDIARRGDPPLLELLRAAPGVVLAGSGRGTTVALARAASLRNCQPVLYVDGLRTNRSTDPPDRVPSLLQAIGARTVDGLEIYAGLSRVPPELGGAEARCGAIAVWTRTEGR